MKALRRIPSRVGFLTVFSLCLAIGPAWSCDSTDSVGRIGDGGVAGKPGSGGVLTGTGGATGKGGAGGSGGADAAVDGYQCPLTNVYCPDGYTTDSYGCTVCAGSSGGSGSGGRAAGGGATGTGGRGGTTGNGGAPGDAAPDGHECPPLTDIYCARYVLDAYGCTVCAPDGTGGSGGNGSGGNGTRVTGTGGGGICTNCVGTGGSGTGGAGGQGGAGGAIDGGRDGVVVCGSTICGADEYCCNPYCNQCVPVGITGCGPCLLDAASETDGNGCQADPQNDGQCGGTKPSHFYRCILTMLESPCAILSIGDVTNTFCCP